MGPVFSKGSSARHPRCGSHLARAVKEGIERVAQILGHHFTVGHAALPQERVSLVDEEQQATPRGPCPLEELVHLGHTVTAERRNVAACEDSVLEARVLREALDNGKRERERERARAREWSRPHDPSSFTMVLGPSPRLTKGKGRLVGSNITITRLLSSEFRLGRQLTFVITAHDSCSGSSRRSGNGVGRGGGAKAVGPSTNLREERLAGARRPVQQQMAKWRAVAFGVERRGRDPSEPFIEPRLEDDTLERVAPVGAAVADAKSPTCGRYRRAQRVAERCARRLAHKRRFSKARLERGAGWFAHA